MSESNTNGYLSPYIGDGYDCEGVIPASPGRWSEVRIRYRPLSADEESELMALQRQFPDRSIVSIYADKFAGTKDRPGNLKSWTLKDHDGKPVAVTAENIGRLSPWFFKALGDLIDGSTPQAVADTKNLSAGCGST